MGPEKGAVERAADSRPDRAFVLTADGAFAVGPDGRINRWNQVAKKILGYSSREAIGRPCCDLFVATDDGGARLCYRGCHAKTLVQMGKLVPTFDMPTRTKTGRPIWISLSTLVLPTGRARRELRVHLFRDVTTTRELLTFIREQHSDSVPLTQATRLTRRELEILRLVARGLNTQAAAERLHVSQATVRNHMQNIFHKLGVHSRVEAMAYASRHRLLSVDAGEVKVRPVTTRRRGRLAGRDRRRGRYTLGGRR